MNNHLGDTNKMVDTPRTDEQINGKPCTRFECLVGDSLRDALVPSQFARQLERELNAANQIIRQQQLLEEENLRLKDKIAQLYAWVQEQKQRIKRLEEAGDEMMSEPCEYTFEQWIKAKEAKL